MEFNSDEPGVVSFSQLSDLGQEQESVVGINTENLTEEVEKEERRATDNPLFEGLTDLSGDAPKAGENEEGEQEDILEQKPKSEGEKPFSVANETSDTYKKLITSLWGDAFDTIVQENEDGEEVEVPLEELEVTPEMFKEIYDAQVEAMKESLTANKISTEGISDFTKNLIEIDKRGGNVTELLQIKQSVLDPIESLDLDNSDHQKYAVALYYQMQGTKSEKEIEILVSHYEEEGTLEDLARQAVGTLKEDVQKRVEQEKQIAIEAEQKRKELLKSYKKDFRGHLDKFELKDTIKNKIVDLATKVNDKNQFELDLKYGEYRRDPEKAARLALFLLDEEEFIKQVTNKEVQKTKLDSAKKLRIVRKSPSDVDYSAGNQKPKKDSVVLFDDLAKM